LGLSFKNSAELNKIIDNKLPYKRPIFTRHEVKDAGESYDLFMRNIIQCVKSLYGDPEHAQYLAIVPERHYADANKTIRFASCWSMVVVHPGILILFKLLTRAINGKIEMKQKAIESINPGATIIPIII
jgi:hypothetical protein